MTDADSDLDSQSPEPADAGSTRVDSAGPSKSVLGVLVALGVTSAFWAFFLWWQLLRARSGFEPVCIGSGGCADLWDAAFASGIHRWTGLPVAAWGAVWGTLAAFLPLQALGASDQEQPSSVPWVPALLWVGVGGLAGVVLLLAVSAVEGTFCGSCAVTYGLTIAYGLLAWFGARHRGFSAKGLATAGIAMAVAWGLFLYPGLRTPKNVFKESREAFEAAASSSVENPHRVEEPVHTDKSVVPEDNPLRVSQWPLSAEEQSRRLAERLSAAPTPWLAALSGIIEKYRNSPLASPSPAPRHLMGPADADLRLTVFTDSQCGHCAQLHGALTVMGQLFPENAFSVDSRHFPLDGQCNPHLGPNPDRASCPAAKARICIEHLPNAWELETDIYALQQDMSEAKIFDLLAPHLSNEELRACMGSAATAQALSEDVEFAMVYDPHGTPVVLVNGRVWPHDAMMIYVLILAGGNVDHPAFANLPPAPPESEHQHQH